MSDRLEPTHCRLEAEAIPGGPEGPVGILLGQDARLAAQLAYDALAAIEAVLAPIYDLQEEDRVPLREEGIAKVHAVLKTIEHQRKQAQAVEGRLKLLLDVLHDHRTVEVPGVGRMRINNPPKKRYDGDKLLSRLAARISDEVFDKETGEVPPLAVVCEKVARATAQATGSLTPSFAGWRVGALKEHGIDLADYEYEERGTAPKVVEVKGKAK